MEKYVVGIGAANVDIYGKSTLKLKEHFDHPANIKTAVGGVTRNVLENLALLKVNTKLLSAVGDDNYGDLIIAACNSAKIDTKNVVKIKGGKSGVFMQIQDKNNDMHMALCDMSINRYIDINYLKKNLKLINNANAVVLDPSLDNEVLEYIFENVKAPIFVDPISEVYAKKIKPYLKNIYCIKPNKNELSVLVNMKIKNEDDLLKAYDIVAKTGVKLIVSLGKEGAMYKDENGIVSKTYFKKVSKMVNASGAGDSFFATLIYCYLNNIKADEAIKLAMAAGVVTIMDENTINRKMSIGLLKKTVKKEMQNEL